MLPINQRIFKMESNKDWLNFCRICGLRQLDPPWGEDNKSPNHEICFCCRVEFGHEDWNLEAIKAYRFEWLQNGAQWADPKRKPINWSLEEQMKNIPDCYL